MSAADGAAVTRFQLHGTAIALMLGGGWVAALIRGASGSGKSDLALRCIGQPLTPLFPAPAVQSGARLVADDRADLTVSDTAHVCTISVSPPASIAGLLEVRGLGIVAVPHVQAARLALVVDLVTAAGVPRFPLPAVTAIGHPQSRIGQRVAELPQFLLSPFEASSPMKLMLALARTAATGCPVGADAAKHHYLPEGQ